jgi:hypothetical protein
LSCNTKKPEDKSPRTRKVMPCPWAQREARGQPGTPFRVSPGFLSAGSLPVDTFPRGLSAGSENGSEMKKEKTEENSTSTPDSAAFFQIGGFSMVHVGHPEKGNPTTPSRPLRRCACGCGARVGRSNRGAGRKGRVSRFAPGHQHRVHTAGQWNAHEPGWYAERERRKA